MMKNIIVGFLTLFAVSAINAQETTAEDDDKKTKLSSAFGFQAGFNYATITNSEGSEMVNYHAGIFAEIPLSEKWAFQPEATFSGQGIQLQNANSIHLNYINVDVLAKCYINKFFLLAGPHAGFLVSAKAPSVAIGGGTVDIKDQLKSVDFGGKFGLGYAIDQHTFIQLTYFTGFTQLQKELAPSETASHNSVFQFSVGYKL